MEEIEIRSFCPCIICQNQCFQPPAIVYEHLVMNGIDPSYTNWVFHGEQEPIRHVMSRKGYACLEDELV